MKKPKNEKIDLLERFRKQGIKIFNLEEIKKRKSTFATEKEN